MKKRFTLAGLSAEEDASPNLLSSREYDSDSDFYSSDDDVIILRVSPNSFRAPLARSMAPAATDET